MSILEKIVEKKRDRLSYAKSKSPLSELKSLIEDIERPRNFREAITRGPGPVRFIAEIKKASPSKGLIRDPFAPLAIASVYEKGGAAAISVITEEDFFQGKLEFLTEVKRSVTKPVLRKDFIFDRYQIYEARSAGADAILLISAILEVEQAEEYMHMAGELGMGVLFEVHDEEELEKALAIEATIVGINNRDLKTLRIDRNTSLRIREAMPRDKIVVSESGICSREDVLRVEAAGIDAVLVGTCLVEATDIGAKLAELKGR
ncbi:MAG: indole-3-glycerol phosphate synthase TrpC [Candidatus Sulfobium sp.]|jgi:indole-3-glycerol phosphate synthase